jgi:hypothetical protein
MYLKCAVDNFVHLRIWSVQWIICVAYFDNLYSCISRGEKSRIYHKCHFLYCLLNESSSSLLNYKKLSKSYWDCKNIEHHMCRICGDNKWRIHTNYCSPFDNTLMYIVITYHVLYYFLKEHGWEMLYMQILQCRSVVETTCQPSDQV